MTPLVRREIKEFYIREPLALIVSFLMTVYFFYLFAQGFSTENATWVNYFMIYIIPIAIFSLYSSVLLIRPIYQEMIDGKVELLLGIGFSPLQIWATKTAVLCGIIYFSLIIGYISANLICYLTNLETMISYLNLVQSTILLLVAPLLGIGIVSIMTFLIFIFRNNAIARYLPLILFGILLFISKRLSGFFASLSIGINFYYISIILSIALSIVFISIPYVILRRVKKEQFIK